MAVGSAAVVWLVVAAGRSLGWWALLLGVPALLTRRAWPTVLVAAALVAGLASSAREAGTHGAGLPTGRVVVAGRLGDDPRPGQAGLRAPLDPSHVWDGGAWRAWAGPTVAVTFSSPLAAQAGERVRVGGRLRPWRGWVRGDPVAGILEADSAVLLHPAADPVFRAGNAIRNRVQTVLADRGPPGALLAGFLIGDVEHLPTADAENLRRAGLSHFVAVSGSNVALFLAVWFIAAGPLGWSPGRRALIGAAGLILFVVITRWEPSVVRASFMAGLVLLGKVGGIAMTPWAALGWATATSLLVAPQLAGEVGFQLSVAATGGVLAGGRIGADGRGGVLRRSLVITVGAQAAVAPLLLWHFGTIPLLAPVSNLLAAPLVTIGTALAGVGVVTGLAAVIELALWPANLVLAIARFAAGWPQLGPAGVAVAAGAGLLWARARSLRPVVAVAAAGALALSLLPAARVSVPTVVFLDVGQGDAALVLEPDGGTVLVDGGPDPGRLLGKLRDWGVRRFDLVVATHGDLDHIGGLAAALEAFPVDRLWHPGHPDGSETYRRLLETAAERGVAIEEPGIGWQARLGAVTLEVLGPGRRYADINDESIVLRVGAGSRSVLLTGDIEATAQLELGPVPVDVLKVPHHGAATTDLGWLAASAAAIAVVSVGPNDFGHPDPAVLGVLERAGSEVRRTDTGGDIVIPLHS